MSDIESVQLSETGRKQLSFAMRRIAQVQQVRIASDVGVSAATISRFVSEDLPRACEILAAAGIKLVPSDCEVYDARKIQVLLDLSRDYLNSVSSVADLFHVES